MFRKPFYSTQREKRQVAVTTAMNNLFDRRETYLSFLPRDVLTYLIIPSIMTDSTIAPDHSFDTYAPLLQKILFAGDPFANQTTIDPTQEVDLLKLIPAIIYSAVIGDADKFKKLIDMVLAIDPATLHPTTAALFFTEFCQRNWITDIFEYTAYKGHTGCFNYMSIACLEIYEKQNGSRSYSTKNPSAITDTLFTRQCSMFDAGIAAVYWDRVDIFLRCIDETIISAPKNSLHCQHIVSTFLNILCLLDGLPLRPLRKIPAILRLAIGHFYENNKSYIYKETDFTDFFLKHIATPQELRNPSRRL